MNTYLIHWDSRILSNQYFIGQLAVLIERIVKLGDRFQVDDTTFLVKSDSNPFDIYGLLTQPYIPQNSSEPVDFVDMALLITKIDTENGNTFGLAVPELWKFLEISTEPENNNENKT